MAELSLVQFENKDGSPISEVLQVPNSIELEHLRSLISTTQDLYVNGVLLRSSLEEALTREQRSDTELIKRITLSDELLAAQPALYCSSAFSGHEGPVLAVKYAKNIAVSAGGDKTVRFWDLITKTQYKIVSKHNHWVLCIDSNDELVVSGGMDGFLNIYDLKGSHLKTLARHRNAITAVKLHDNHIISISRDNACFVWNMDGSIHTSWSHSKPLRALGASGEYILTAGADQTIKVYKQYKHCCELRGHSAPVNCLQMYGPYVVSGDDSGQIIVWKNFSVHKRLAHKREVLSLSINPNGLSFASCSFDKAVKLWALDSGTLLATYYHVGPVYKVTVYNDLIVSCSKDKTVKMFRISQNKLLSDLVCDDEVYDFDYRDGHMLCGSRSNKLFFFD